MSLNLGKPFPLFFLCKNKNKRSTSGSWVLRSLLGICHQSSLVVGLFLCVLLRTYPLLCAWDRTGSAQGPGAVVWIKGISPMQDQLSLCLSVSISLSLSVCLSLSLWLCLSLLLCLCLCRSVSVYVSIFVSVYLSSLSLCLCLYPCHSDFVSVSLSSLCLCLFVSLSLSLFSPRDPFWPICKWNQLGVEYTVAPLGMGEPVVFALRAVSSLPQAFLLFMTSQKNC